MPSLGLGLGLPYSPYRQAGGGNGGGGGGDHEGVDNALDFDINVAGDYFTAPQADDDSLDFAL